MDLDYEQRSASLYLIQKVRQYDFQDAISVQGLAGGDALVLQSSVDGQTYQDWIYVDGGALQEELVLAGDRPHPGLAQAITPLSGMSIELKGQRLKLELASADGSLHELHLALRCPSQRDLK
jgi:hypothetical protein